jgi:hypothetical protein
MGWRDVVHAPVSVIANDVIERVAVIIIAIRRRRLRAVAGSL